ncbi:F390 synthetase-related protein [Enterococcus sp. AZ192]|uniref:F390 synthetase-related protein n=1 Tax=unclassified Enterococcus TaxID=2608891 RepID=UPI003D297BE8
MEAASLTIKKIKPFISTYLDVSYQRYLSIKHPKRFRQFQKKRLNRHLKRIVSKSPYYRSLINEQEEISLSDFPIMNKAVMMKEFDQLNTKGISLVQAKKVALQAEENRDFAPKIGTVSVGLSSGTTGNQGVFLVSDEETVQWSAAMMNKALDRKKFRGQAIVIAFFMRANNNLYEMINQGNIQLHFFDLLHPVEENLKQLKQLKPNVIVAQPSMLRMIAHFFDKESLDFSLKEVFSIAEVLEEVDKEFIEQRLSCRLKEIYQATEGFLGISCHHGTLHLNEEIVYIEKEYLADDSTRFVPIITDLYRTTQPLIRYRHTDILVERVTPCPCGSSFIALEKIEGREDDCFIFGEGKEAQVIFPDFIRYAITRSSEEIRQFKCIQQTRQIIEVTLELSPQALESEIIQTVKAKLKALVKDVDEQKALTITINVASLDYEQDQKMRRVISNVKGGER